MKKLKKTLLSLKFIFKPSYWIMNYSYSREWDKTLNQLIDDNYYFDEITGCTASIKGHIVWITNHPYASFRIYCPDIDVRPSRLTIERAHNHLIKSIIKQHERT